MKKLTLCDLYKKRYCSISVRYGVPFWKRKREKTSRKVLICFHVARCICLDCSNNIHEFFSILKYVCMFISYLILGGSNDVFYFIVILLNEYLTKTHIIIIMSLYCLNVCITPYGVRLRACLLDRFKKHYSSLLKYNYSWDFSY